jgi:hypothetical protein
VIFIARVSPGNAAGTVQFKDGATNIGGPARVFGGFALGFTTRLTQGSHSLTAEFTPTNPAAYGPSSDSEPLTVRSLFGSLFGFLR